jgi:hypothetical protein
MNWPRNANRNALSEITRHGKPLRLLGAPARICRVREAALILHERTFLCGILGVFRQVHHPECDVVNPRLMPGDQMFERLAAASLGAPDQLEVLRFTVRDVSEWVAHCRQHVWTPRHGRCDNERRHPDIGPDRRGRLSPPKLRQPSLSVDFDFRDTERVTKARPGSSRPRQAVPPSTVRLTRAAAASAIAAEAGRPSPMA